MRSKFELVVILFTNEIQTKADETVINPKFFVCICFLTKTAIDIQCTFDSYFRFETAQSGAPCVLFAV